MVLTDEIAHTITSLKEIQYDANIFQTTILGTKHCIVTRPRWKLWDRVWFEALDLLPRIPVSHQT